MKSGLRSKTAIAAYLSISQLNGAGHANVLIFQFYKPQRLKHSGTNAMSMKTITHLPSVMSNHFRP